MFNHQADKNLAHLFSNKIVGIWGFGKTGQSILECLSSYAKNIFILEENQLTEDQKKIIQMFGGQKIEYQYLPQFLEACDIVIPSPGIDINKYTENYPDLFMSELDIFNACTTTPIIAITGSVGKTTTVFLLEQLMTKLGKKVIALGNIGQPMLSFIKKDNQYDYFILEVSSFQLEHTKSFKPKIATILNILPNHLDRHHTMEEYISAKGKILAYQTESDCAILPLDYMNEFWPFVKKQNVIWVNNNAYDYIITKLSELTVQENCIIILSILEKLGFEIEKIIPFIPTLKRPDHRMEFVATINNIDFYNDSKATIPESTLKAIEQCNHKPTILIIGGLSKGINRNTFIKQLPANLIAVICFGKEADQLALWCKERNFITSSHTTLEDACNKAIMLAQSGDLILFSPSGSSYDLFKNFEERGNKFKEFVNHLNKNS